MYKAHCATSGNYIPGEVKLGITLRLLAGASYLDIFPSFSASTAISIFYMEFIRGDKRYTKKAQKCKQIHSGNELYLRLQTVLFLVVNCKL
jgi:hypothetical protein